MAVNITPALGRTRIRHKVVAMTMVLGAILYLDRVTISVTRPYVARDLNLTATQMGYVFSAFYFAYALFEMPTGWLGDRYGPRKTLVRVVLWWSLFTAVTGWTWSLGSLIAVRFLFGMGEAGCFPNLTRAFSTWSPSRRTSSGARSAPALAGAASWSCRGSRSFGRWKTALACLTAGRNSTGASRGAPR